MFVTSINLFSSLYIYALFNTELAKPTSSSFVPQFNVVNNPKTTFGSLAWHKLEIELGEWGFKKNNMTLQGIYHNVYQVMTKIAGHIE
jgi:hypothetical protein